MKPKPMEARYGRWTVLDPSIATPAHGMVRVVCECGTLREVVKHALTQGRSRSCGCLTAEQLRGGAWPELSPHRDAEVKPGARFGRWTALTLPYSEPGLSDRVAQCRCECGAEVAVVARHLLSGHSKSCGCLRRDGARILNQSSAP